MSTLFDGYPTPSLDLLLDWFRTHDILLDDRLHVKQTQESGWTVFARQALDVEETVCRIPKRSMFSRRTSSLDVLRDPAEDLIPPTHVLALHLLHEIALGPRSSFFGYLQSLPRTPPPLAMFWEEQLGDDGKQAWKLVEHGQVGYSLRRSERSLGTATVGGKLVDWGAGGLASLKAFYVDRVRPVMLALPLLGSATDSARQPSLETFLHAYALVSSRCFTVDTYHQIALVSPADIFNHSPDHHVHFSVDEFVCRRCGSLIPCVHDTISNGLLPSRLSHLHELEESDLLSVLGGVDSGDICVNAFAEEGDEIFSTYGNLSSAQLACEYGFVPEEAGTLSEDRLYFDLPTSLALQPSSTLGSRPHFLIESSLACPNLQPPDRCYISPDGQLSEALFRYAADKVGLDELDAVAVLFDEGEYRADEWDRLTTAVVKLLQDQLEGYASGESLLSYLEDDDVGPITKMAATFALAERATLEACLASWQPGADDGDIDQQDDGC